MAVLEVTSTSPQWTPALPEVYPRRYPGRHPCATQGAFNGAIDKEKYSPSINQPDQWSSRNPAQGLYRKPAAMEKASQNLETAPTTPYDGQEYENPQGNLQVEEKLLLAAHELIDGGKLQPDDQQCHRRIHSGQRKVTRKQGPERQPDGPQDRPNKASWAVVPAERRTHQAGGTKKRSSTEKPGTTTRHGSRAGEANRSEIQPMIENATSNLREDRMRTPRRTRLPVHPPNLH